MEENERQKIQRLLPDLIEKTDCNPLFISVLTSLEILGSADEDLLDGTSTAFEKNRKLYSLLLNRVGAFQHLLNALNRTGQTEVISILTEDVATIQEKYFGSQNSSQYITLNRKTKKMFEVNIESNDSPSKKSMHEKSVMFNVYKPSQLFTGRVHELEEMRKTVRPGSTTVICQTSIVGLGGIGKTELAKQFISLMRSEGENADKMNIIWLNAETEADLSNDFRTLAKDELEIKIQDSSKGIKDIKTIVKEVYEKLADKFCLFVFDNAENTDYLIRYLPISHSYTDSDARMPSVLITSRDSDWAPESQLIVNLDVWKEDEAIEFVRKALKLDEIIKIPSNSEEHIKNLVERLQYFPLAIHQAASYIQKQAEFEQTYGAADYIAELEIRKKQFLNLKLTGYRLTTYETWKTTVTKISQDETFGESAIQILNILAYFSADAIDSTIFSEIFADSFIIRESLKLLKRYSMIKLIPRKTGGGGVFISIHRLVQDVIRIDINSGSMEKEILLLALKLTSINITPNSISHTQTVWTHAKKYADLCKQFVDVPHNMVYCEFKHYKLQDAVSMAKKEIEFLQTILPEESRMPVVILEGDIGRILSDQKHYSQAIEILKLAVDHGNKITSKADRVLLEIKLNLGNAHIWNSDFLEASRIFRETVSEWQCIPEHSSDTKYVDCVFHLAVTLYLMEDYDEALKQFEIASKIFSEYFGDSQHGAMRCLIITTDLYIQLVKCYLNKFDKPIAELRELYNKAFSLPDSDIDMAKVLVIGHNIGWYLYYNAGRINDALLLFKDIVQRGNKIFGKRHIYLMSTQCIYCDLLIETEMYDEAFDCGLETYQVLKSQLGEYHIDTLLARRIVASALSGKKLIDESLFILSDIMQRMRDCPARYDFDAFYTKLELAKVLEEKQFYSAALEYLNDAENDLDTKLTKSEYPMFSERVSELISRVSAKAKFL